MYQLAKKGFPLQRKGCVSSSLYSTVFKLQICINCRVYTKYTKIQKAPCLGKGHNHSTLSCFRSSGRVFKSLLPHLIRSSCTKISRGRSAGPASTAWSASQKKRWFGSWQLGSRCTYAYEGGGGGFVVGSSRPSFARVMLGLVKFSDAPFIILFASFIKPS
jgi:hypothetical protein